MIRGTEYERREVRNHSKWRNKREGYGQKKKNRKSTRNTKKRKKKRRKRE